MIPAIFTYSDAIVALQDWAGFTGSAPPDTLRKVKRSIENSYRALTYLKNWSYYEYRGRINSNPMYNTGTIAYTNSTRTVTLTGGTLPSNTNLCILRIGPVDYPVVNGSANIGAGTFQLSVNTNPNADIAAGSPYTLYQDTYPLPVNFKNMGTLRDCNRSSVLQFMSPNEFVASRMLLQSPAIPYRYTLRGDPSYLGIESISFYPPPDQFYQYDYMGIRQPRPFTVPVPYNTGTVASSGTAITGTGTTFNSNMIGCILRFSGSTTIPTGTVGLNPYTVQRVVTSFTSSTVIGIDQSLSAEVSGVGFEISDPIDMESSGMYTAFLRLCELELGQLMNRDDVSRLRSQYTMAERLALESDQRSRDDKPGGARAYQRVPDYTPLTDANS